MYETPQRRLAKKIWSATKFITFVGTVVAGSIGFSYLSMKAEQEKKDYLKSIQPNTAEKTKDMDGNGLDDIILTLNNGKRTPLFAFEKNGQINYYSSEQILQENPNSIIDYKRIEERLNQ
jgi:hypothetical protein